MFQLLTLLSLIGLAYGGESHVGPQDVFHICQMAVRAQHITWQAFQKNVNTRRRRASVFTNMPYVCAATANGGDFEDYARRMAMTPEERLKQCLFYVCRYLTTQQERFAERPAEGLRYPADVNGLCKLMPSAKAWHEPYADGIAFGGLPLDCAGRTVLASRLTDRKLLSNDQICLLSTCTFMHVQNTLLYRPRPWKPYRKIEYFSKAEATVHADL